MSGLPPVSTSVLTVFFSARGAEGPRMRAGPSNVSGGGSDFGSESEKANEEAAELDMDAEGDEDEVPVLINPDLPSLRAVLGAADAVVEVDAWRGFSPPRMVAPRSRVVTVSSRMCPWCAASPSRSACVERGETDGELAVLKYAEVVGELRVIPLSSRMSGGC